MPILIDGWNFIRNIQSDINDDDGEALESAAKLITYLEKFQLEHSDPIIVVFDSRKEFLDMDYSNNEKLKIVAARNADNYIKKHIDNIPHKQRRNLRVVSSDKEVYYYAKSSYATALKSEEFWEKIRKRGMKYVSGRDKQ